MNWNNIHLVNYKSLNALFVGSSMTLISVNGDMFDVIKRLQLGEHKDDLINEYKDKNTNIVPLLDQLEQEYTTSNLNSKLRKKDRVISKITLHVSNACNLKCKYCYANEGTYGLPTGKLTRESADNFIKFCCTNFDKVEYIHFFGGEPFLNLEIMSYICKVFNQSYANGTIKFLPKFGLVTNGTILSDDIVDFVDNYIHSITVSIDGGKEINDINRIYKNGLGTFDEIHKFIITIKEHTKSTILFESTFTKEHISHGYEHKDIYNSLSDLLGISGFIANEMSINYDYLCKINEEKIEIENINFDDLPIAFWNVLNCIVNKRGNIICPMHDELFAVSTQGDIYPCHLLLGKPNVFCGNIVEENIYTRPEKFEKILSKTLSKNNMVCQCCWANKICGGCAVDFFFNNSTDDFDSTPREVHCQLTRNHITKLLSIILAVRSDRKTWNRLLLYMKENKAKINNART